MDPVTRRPHSLEDVAVSFDFDGVLARSPFGRGVLYPALREIARSVSDRTGAPWDREESRLRGLAMEEFRGRTARGDYVQAYDWQAIVEKVAREDGEIFEGSLARRTDEFALGIGRSADRSLVYPDALEALRKLKERGAFLLLLTNGFREFQLPMVRAFGMEPCFDAILAADDLGTVKPFPEAFEKAFRSCAHLRVGRRYHVGDTLIHDVLGARDSGIFAVWIDRDLPEELARLGRGERMKSGRLDEVLREKLARENEAHGVAGSGRPGEEQVRPDAVIAGLGELEGVIDGAP